MIDFLASYWWAMGIAVVVIAAIVSAMWLGKMRRAARDVFTVLDGDISQGFANYQSNFTKGWLPMILLGIAGAAAFFMFLAGVVVAVIRAVRG